MYLDFFPSHAFPKKSPFNIILLPFSGACFSPFQPCTERVEQSVVSGMFRPSLAPLWEDSGADVSAAFPAEQGKCTVKSSCKT